MDWAIVDIDFPLLGLCKEIKVLEELREGSFLFFLFFLGGGQLLWWYISQTIVWSRKGGESIMDSSYFYTPGELQAHEVLLFWRVKPF